MTSWATAPRPSGDQLLERLKTEERVRLRVYIGAAPGVGKTYTMLEDARDARKRRASTSSSALSKPTGEQTPRRSSETSRLFRARRIAYKGAELEEMDLDAVLARRPQIAVVDELAHSNVAGQPA